MATFRKRINKWQARVQRQGFPPICKSFLNRQDAEVWARKVESELDVGIDIVTPKKLKLTNGELLTKYINEITPRKKGASIEVIRLNRIIRDEKICKYQCINTTSQHIATYRDLRLKTVSPTTVRLELAAISHAYNTAIREWGMRLINPVTLISLPKPNKARTRRLSLTELERLHASLEVDVRKDDGTFQKGACRNTWMKPLVILAVETAMRQSELLRLRWQDIDLIEATAILHDTKNGDARLIPLTRRAVETLKHLNQLDQGYVFPITPSAVKQAFTRAVARSGLEDFHFHDLRHEATSRLAEKLSNVLELSAVTGHKDLRMLKRYYHPRIADLVKKVNL